MSDILEKLAEIEHEQWVGWSKDIAETEQITPARLERWKKLWCPYSELSEELKELDRNEARKVINIIEEVTENADR